MSKFVLSFHGGEQPSSPEEGAKHMQEWRDWVSDLGEAVINPGTPLGPAKCVSATEVKPNEDQNVMSGFSVVEAENIAVAIEMAKTCPFVTKVNGTIRVAEVREMPQSAE